MTPAAHEWVNENVDIPSYMWRTVDSFAADHRPAQSLLDGMLAEGFNVGVAADGFDTDPDTE